LELKGKDTMTTFVCIRHGESEANSLGLFAGHLNVPLTALGRRQAALTREFLKGEAFDLAVASPLLRAYETGSIALGDRALPLLPVEGLREIDGGLWEGLAFAELPSKYPESYAVWKNTVGLARPDGGERVADLGERVWETVKRLAKEHPCRRVLLASHATPIRMLRVKSLGLTPAEAHNVPWPSNASVSIFEVEGDSITCAAYDVCEHIVERTRLSPLI
jgi:probable phosphoglycerate mutase